MIQEPQVRKQYPSECITEDLKRLETQIRVLKRWLNTLLKQANAREVTDVLDIFRDTKNFYALCKFLAGQKLISVKESTPEDASYLDRATSLLEKLYGHEISSVMQTAATEIIQHPSWESEAQLRTNAADLKNGRHNLLLLGLDSIWIFIVAVRAGTGPPANLTGSVSSSGSTLTRRSLGSQSIGQSHLSELTCVRTPCVDRWLISQDERLMAWCIAVTEGYSGLNICNFTHSWRDGLAFLAVAHQSRPDLFAYETRLEKTANQNLSLAFHLATSEFATPRLLEPMDMHPDCVDARATATYVLELRKAIERDRKRRSRGILEIQTTAMTQEQAGAEPDESAVNVTVLSRSSPTSSASTSEITWLDEEFDEDSGDESKPSLPDPEMFDSMIETTLAWLLAMEERFANNDLTKYDTNLQIDNFQWTGYSQEGLRKNLSRLTHLSADEKSDVEALLTLSGERLKKLHNKILSRVDEAMSHFETHEDLTAHLSRRQMAVGRCLRLGAKLIQTCRDRSQLEKTDETDNTTVDMNELDKEEQNRIRQLLLNLDPEVIQRQTALLATRWNNLCRANQTMGRRITTCLLRRQGMLLIAIRLQLEKLEAEQSRQAELPIGPSIRELKSQLEVNRSLEEGIEIGEILAERLDNFITLVPMRPPASERDSETEKEKSLESIIGELATRWSRLVEWVNTRYAKLQNALLHWRHFEEEANVLSDWLNEVSEEVSKETAKATAAVNSKRPFDRTDSAKQQEEEHPGQTASQIAAQERLQSVLAENDAEIEAVEACLATHESRWAQLLASLDRRAQSLREACGDTEEVSRLVEATVDQLVNKWSQLAEPQISTEDWVDHCANEMENYSELAQAHKEGENDEESAETDSDVKKTTKQAPPAHLDVPKASASTSGETAPEPPSPTGYRADFESKAEELLNWLENSVEALELITMDKKRALEATGQAQAVGRKVSTQVGSNAENPVSVIARISKEVSEWRDTMKHVMSMGERYREELLQVGENVEELDQLFDEVEEHWGYLDTLLVEAERQVRVATRSAEFQQEAAKIHELLSKSQESSEPKTAATKTPDSGNGETPATSEASASSVPTTHIPVDDYTEHVRPILEQLNNQLSRVREVLSSPLLFANPDDFDDQLVNTKNLARDVEDEQSRFLNVVAKRGKDVDKNSKIEAQVEAMRARLESTCNELKSRVAAIQDLNEQLEFFMNQFEGIEKWLTDMRDYLDSVSQANLPSITVIQAQLQESCEALNDMQTLEPTLKKVNDVAKQLITYFKPDYEKILRNRLSALHSNWEQVRILTKSNRDHLESLLAEKIATQEVKALEEGGGEDADSSGRMTGSVTGKTSRTPECTSLPDIALSRASQLSSPEETKAAASASRAPRGSTGNALTILRVNIDELEQWMSDAKKKLAEFAVIEAEKDLKFMENTINELSEGISERRYILAALDTHVAVGMLDQPLSDTESLLTRAHFADLESALGAERERVRAAAYHLEDFNTVLSAEQRWLDSVSNTLKRLEEGSYTDTSELSDDLENLDRLADEHSAEDVDRLESLTGLLESANIMAKITKDKLKAYKDNLASTQADIENARTKYRNLLDKWQDYEAEANELESWLLPVGEKHDGVGNESEVAKKWRDHMKKTDDLLKQMNTQIEELDKEPGNTNLSNQFKECRTRIQDAYRALQQTMEHFDDQSPDFEPRMTKVRREIGLIETQAYLLDIVSVSPQDIRTSLENAKDLMASLNEIKADIDYVLNASKGQNKKGVEFPERLAHELPSLCERHKKLVMSVLLALERLENALPLAEKLDSLVTDLGQQLASVEEVTDYLETADCPVSRRDMIQRVSTTLNRLCNKDGLVDQIRETATRLKPFTVASTSDTAADYFREIEERLQRVTAAKKAFLSQLEETKESPEEVTPSSTALSAQAALDKSVKREEVKEVKPAPKKTIEHLIDPNAAVSPIVRELAREIRDHFRGIVLFNRFCLGTNIPLSSMKPDIRETTNTLNVNNSYPTTIAERMATVKLFHQQRTHLEDRLKELIVNAGANDSVDRLQDLLNLQGCWHETNDELDKRGEHMALLEQQLLTTDRTISDYLERPSESLRSKSVGQIKRLEETYDWNLSFDLERVNRRTDVSASATSSERKMEIPAQMRAGWLFNDPLIEQYEKTLETAARYLNDIQINLDCCKSGQMAELGSLIGRIDSKFVDCCHLLASAADVLDRLTTRGSKPELPYRSRRGEKLSERATTPDDIVWLKVLLETQKNRLESYSAEFKTNRSNWQKRSEQWKNFCRKLESLKSLLSGWNWPAEDSKREPSEDLLDKLSVACKHYVALNRQGLELVQTEFFSESTPAGESKAQSADELPNSTVPPAVPPRKNSLRRGHNVVSGEEDRDFIQNELNNLRSQLIKLCQRYRCQHLLEASSDQITTGQSGVQNGLQARPKSAEQKSAYVNVDWLDDEVQPLNLSTLESLGPYKTEVEACLRGLANESRWFVQESGLVPASLLRRKSDDILLASAGRKKPTSPAETRLDFCFWHGYTDEKGEKKEEGEYVEFTPNWLKSKWAELEHLIEVTFEHEKRANNWTRKATQLAKILRENDVAKTSAVDSRIVARLEAGCHNATEAISLAQTALKRRKTTLTRWQSDLVLLDTMLAQIKTVMGSYDVGRFGVKGETPNCWLADLHQKLSGAFKEPKYPNTLDHWLMELDPRNPGLGKHLNNLAGTWKEIQNKLSSTDQSLMVCVPSHIALQVTSLLDEWESLRTALKLPGFDSSLMNEVVLEQGSTVKTASQPPAIGQTTATVICAPSAWPIGHSPSLDSQSQYRQTVGPVGPMAAQATSPTVARMHHEVEQLTRWLNSVSYFVDNCRVRLGDRFDEETVSRQLQQAKLATKEGSQMDIHQPYHPAALQMKIQQFLTELEARKPQLDRILVEKDRLPVSDTEDDEFGSQVTDLPGLWSAAEKTMNERSAELGSMLVDTQKLKDLERDVDRWINKAEAELDGLEFTKESENDPSLPPASHRLFYNQELNRKRIQEIVDSLAEGRNKLALYSKESDSVQARFDSEDSSKLKEDLSELTHRLKNLEDRVMQAQKIAEMQETMAEKEKSLQLPTLQEQRQQQSTLERLSPRENISERLENIEQQLNRVSAMESDLRRRDVATAGSAGPVDHRAQLINELQTIQGELNSLSGFVGGNVKPMSSEMSAVPDGELLSRWKQLRDKMNTLRQSIQSNHSQNSLFLAKLKDLNNWVAHRDAAFREIVCPLHGDILFILKLRESMLNLLKELETNRAQIEDVLSHGRARYGEEHSDSNLPGELEPELEGSDLAGGKGHPEGDGVPASTTAEEHAKRTVRRIRRYLYYLKKRWVNLNTSMLDYKQQLDMISERLTNFQSLFGDAIEQVRSARSVTLRWTPVECIPTDRLGSEMEQVQSFYEACEPLTLLISNLDRQINQFQESHVTIDANVIAQLSVTRNELEQVRFITKNRMHVINQTLASVQAAGQRIQPLARTPIMRMPTEIGRSPVSNLEMLQTASGAVSPAQVPVQVPLADSVSPPWERCVHPSGTQVPYYKNHQNQETQWDHPILDELMQSMKQLNVIRFAEYRTTLKLRRLQKTLCLDSLSISIIAESLKYIGHSQLIEGANTDPFDRTINIPQMIDCLLQLFGRANASYGQNLGDFSTKYSDFSPTGQAEFSASPSKNSTPSRCSTLPSSAKQSMRNSSQKSGCAVIRSASAAREKHPADEFAENRLSTGQGPIRDSKLTEGDRSSSLPGQMVSGVVSPEHRQQRHRRSSSKSRRHYVLGPTKHPVNVCVDLTLNWLLNVYDRMRKGTIRALSFKVAITILSVANLDDKYRYLFSLIADSNGCVDEQRLSALLYECILIPKNLGENGWFGKEDFPTTVKLCFNQVLEIARGSERYHGASPLRSESIPVRHFLTWLRFAPPTLMWIPLLHRVMLAEQVIHHVRCAVCQKQPLIGLRYRCLRCFNLDLCQQCFFSGRTTRNHKVSHPMQEYCSNSTSGDSFRDFTRIVRNRFRSKDRIRRPRISNVIQGKHGGSGWTRSSRSRCCETGSFGEELSKPRPAPTFDSESSTFVPSDALTETPRVRAKLLKANSFENAEHAASESLLPNVAASLPPPPQSRQTFPLPESRLPPRAASDNRQLLSEVRYTGVTASRPPFTNETPLGLISPSGAGEPIADDEHRLIAEYSRELRQQSEPELQSPTLPTQVAVSTMGQTLMDRSTISDGLPVTAPLVSEHPLQPFTGHLSLDRRQLGRGPGHGILPYNGYVNGSPFDGGSDQYGRYSAYEQQQVPVRMDAQLSYRPTGKLNFPMASNPSLLRETTPFEAYAPGIQRSYSLRARSQPPSEAHLQAVRQGLIAPPQDPRSLWYQPTYNAQPATFQTTNQTIRSLEEESRALQLEYERLRQRAMSPGTQASSYAAASRLQAQQAQQRFAQMQMQYPPVIRQQSDFARSRGLSPRVSLQRPPSASPLLTNAPLYSGLPSIPGRINYSGSLGRAYSASNGFGYPTENFNADSRVTAYPYRIDGPLDLSVPIPVPGEIAAEARLLREHKGRLEARMQQLEDHNRQLEQQLQRLRQYLVAGGASGAAGSLGSTTKVASDIVTIGSKPTLRQRSASGGLAPQLNIGDGQNHVTGGSFGQLPVTETNEAKERIPAPIYSPPPASTTADPRLKPVDQNLPTNVSAPPLTVSDQRRLFPNML